MDQALALLGVKRLVVGHTPQDKINCACGCVWRIDLGLSAAMGGGRPEAIEIIGDEVLGVCIHICMHICIYGLTRYMYVCVCVYCVCIYVFQPGTVRRYMRRAIGGKRDYRR